MKTKLLFAFFALSVWIARAQNYQLDWFTLDGGGGTSIGNGYSLSGTIGQPDATTSSGGAFKLEGGFWPAFETNRTNSLNLRIGRMPTGVVIAWSVYHPGYKLEAAALLPTNHWVEIPIEPVISGFDYTVLLPADPAQRYFRLRQP